MNGSNNVKGHQNRRDRRRQAPLARSRLPVLGLIGLIFVFGAAALVFKSRGANTQAAVSPPSTESAAQAQRDALMENLIAQTRHFKGSPDAPVTILEYSDFQ